MAHDNELTELARAPIPQNPQFADQILRAAFAHKPAPVTWQKRFGRAIENLGMTMRRPAYAFATIAFLAAGVAVISDPASFGITAAEDGEVEIALYDMYATY